MNFLSLFVLIPVLMLGGLLLASDIKQIRAVCATGASLLLLLAVALTVLFLGERNSGNTADMLFKIDDIIAYVSRFMTLKIGDLLFTGTPAGVGPVSVGQHLQGYLGEEKLLDFHIR